MMKQLICTGVLAVTVMGGLAGCTSLHVKSDVNRAVVGSVQCHTYAWAGNFKGNSPLRDSIANPVNESRLRGAIAAQLATQGVQPAARTLMRPSAWWATASVPIRTSKAHTRWAM